MLTPTAPAVQGSPAGCSARPPPVASPSPTGLGASAPAWVQPGADALFRELYADLRRLARSRLQRSEDITLLDTTALVHESYLRFQANPGLAGLSTGQFLAYASRVMRFVVIDFVRQRHAERRGGEQQRVTLNTDVAEAVPVDDEDVLRLHEALEALAQVDDRLARIVEMRCFGGLGEADIAAALGVNERTVRRGWQKARLMLRLALE